MSQIDNNDGVTIHLEPDILEWEVKWALGSITANKYSGGDGIPAELFQIVKDDTLKVLHSICHPIWKTQQWPQDWKRTVLIPIPKKDNSKERSNYCTAALISHTTKVMLKILQARLQQYMNWELPDVQAGFRKDRGTRDQMANIHWIIEKAKEFQKNIYFCFFDDPVDVGNLISGSSAFSKSSLNILKLLVHVLLKPDLQNFEHYFASMWMSTVGW